MNPKHLREDRNCLNCGKTVEVRYCTYCGQENTKTEQAFYFAFLSYFQNKAKYDKSLISSIKILISRPGFLSSEFLKGKRATHIEPVRFYIAISFLVFFLTSILFGFHQKQSFRFYYEPDDDVISLTEESIAKMDQKALYEHPNIYFLYHPFYEKLKSLKKSGWSDEQISEKLISKFVINIPTALFLYLPIFTLSLWIAYHRKPWTYYRHSIFSIHFFTLLVIAFFVWYVLETTQILMGIDLISKIVDILQNGIILFCLYYFIRASFKFYKSNIALTLFKSIFLLIINISFFGCLLAAILYYTFVTID